MAEEVEVFSELLQADQRIQVVAEQVRSALEKQAGKAFNRFLALIYRVNSGFMQEYVIMIQTDCDECALVHVAVSPLAVFPPQVTLKNSIYPEPLTSLLEPQRLIGAAK